MCCSSRRRNKLQAPLSPIIPREDRASTSSRAIDLLPKTQSDNRLNQIDAEVLDKAGIPPPTYKESVAVHRSVVPPEPSAVVSASAAGGLSPLQREGSSTTSASMSSGSSMTSEESGKGLGAKGTENEKDREIVRGGMGRYERKLAKLEAKLMRKTAKYVEKMERKELKRAEKMARRERGGCCC